MVKTLEEVKEDLKYLYGFDDELLQEVKDRHPKVKDFERKLLKIFDDEIYTSYEEMDYVDIFDFLDDNPDLLK